MADKSYEFASQRFNGKEVSTDLYAHPVHVVGSDVGGFSTVISQTPTIGTVAYTAKDAVGGTLTFADAVRTTGGSGRIKSVTVIDNDGEDAELNVILFDQAFTATADAATFDPTDADLQNCIGFINIPAANYEPFNDNSVGVVTTDLPFVAAATTIYGQLQCPGTPTYTAVNDLTIKLGIVRD